MTTRTGRRAWADLGGDPAALALVSPPQPPVALPSRLDVGGLLGDCVGLATLAAREAQVARGARVAPGAVVVDGRRVTTAAQSERHFRLDGSAPEVWAPLSGFWEAADGWVRTHGNYPHHAERLARMLGIPAGSPKERAAAALARRPVLELEDTAATVGAILGAVRTPAAWAQHAQAAATGTLPVVERHVDDDGAAPRTWGGPGAGPLDGVRVLDLTRVLAGPVATRNLALLGADVLRIDPPHLPETGWIHLDTGAGKRSTTLDLRAAGDRGIFDDLLRGADVVVTGYRPGALDALGLSPEALCERRPGIVVASVSAWGAHGPWAGRRGFDSIVQAVTGIATVVGADGRPGALPAQALDHSAGHLLTAAICRALCDQRADGGTRRVAVALVTLARELLGGPSGAPAGTPADGSGAAAEPTLQTGETAAGVITTAAPVLTGPGLPTDYPALASPWASDEPRWRDGTGS